ncbi:MAG: hypothetical protein CL581_16325 [Alteromonadaceae bacterium]|nr:hypothetical protein [Alteromonadaceae bacterium]
MNVEASVTESKRSDVDHVHLSVNMDREAALVLMAVVGAVTGDPRGPRGVTSVIYSQLGNTLQWTSGESMCVRDEPFGDVQLVPTSSDIHRKLGERGLSLWTNKMNPDEVAVD